jgi:hypothetical protein
MPMTAHRLASGEYLVLVEEDAYGKALMYRFTPPSAPLAAALPISLLLRGLHENHPSS